VDDPGFSEQMASIACMVQALTDQFAAYQRDNPASPLEVMTPASGSGRASEAMVAELAMLVLRMQRDLDDLRVEVHTEIRTGAVVVGDGARQVLISPGEILVERRATSGDSRSGSSVHIQSLVRGAEVRVGAAFQGREDPGVAALINANWEGRFPCALISAQTDAVDGDDGQQELRVQDETAES
jgi:hypothetical protein